jgi:hypothetical protein
MMNWKIYGRKRSWPNLRHYPGNCPEGLRKPSTTLSQDSRSSGRNFNPEPPVYKAGVLTIQPRRTNLIIMYPTRLVKLFKCYFAILFICHPVCRLEHVAECVFKVQSVIVKHKRDLFRFIQMVTGGRHRPRIPSREISEVCREIS